MIYLCLIDCFHELLRGYYDWLSENINISVLIHDVEL